MWGYAVKSTWLKATQAGNYMGWPLLTDCNVRKYYYYPETSETSKGHMNQTWDNVWSTKPKPLPLKKCATATLRGKKVRDIYTKVYNVRITVLFNQTGQFPKHLMHSNKYIMVLVEINTMSSNHPYMCWHHSQFIRKWMTELCLPLYTSHTTPKWWSMGGLMKAGALSWR